MAGLASILVILPIFCSTLAFDIGNTCKIVKSGSYIGDPSSCSGWAYCENSIVKARGNCNSGLYYNARSGQCEDASKVDCQSNLLTMCNGLDSVYKAHPNDCNQYCYCSSGKAICSRCPLKQVFDPTQIKCTWSDQYQCTNNSPCQLVANNEFVKNNNDCSKYYRCLNGNPIEGQCENGQNFNFLKSRCVWAKDFPCSSSSAPSSGIKPKPTKETCSAVKNINGEVVSNNKGEGNTFYVEDNATCRGAFVCKSPTDELPSWTQCLKGTHFQLETQKCVDPIDTNCKYQNRCDGLSPKYQFVASYNSSCKKYQRCENGNIVPNSENKCNNEEYPYFDEVIQACVTEKPDYAICKSL